MCECRHADCPYPLHKTGVEQAFSLDDATPLDRLETSGFGFDNLSQCFRHSGWVRQRKKVWQALQEAAVSDHRLGAFACCGSSCFVLRSRTDPEVVKVAASCCHDRFCLPCAAARSATIAAHVLPYVVGKQTRFVTLTLKHNDAGLAANIDRLYDSFKKLRKHPLWRRSQRGGVAFLEIKRSRDRQSWHPHFHVLTQGKWIDGAKLATLWREITRDSFIVDVRFVAGIKPVLQYVTKYASKPFDPSLFENNDVLVEAILALKSRRMALTFGNWKGLLLTQRPEVELWENLGTLEDVLRKAAKRDEEAIRIIERCCGDKATALIRMAELQAPPECPSAVARPPDDQLFLIDPPSPYARFVEMELAC